MKTEFTDKGWKEITTKYINVERFATKTFISVSQWVHINERYTRIGRKRKTCNCCKKPWKELSGNVNIIFTDKGNKPVCDDCLQNLKKRFDAKAKPLGD